MGTRAWTAILAKHQRMRFWCKIQRFLLLTEKNRRVIDSHLSLRGSPCLLRARGPRTQCPWSCLRREAYEILGGQGDLGSQDKETEHVSRLGEPAPSFPQPRGVWWDSCNGFSHKPEAGLACVSGPRWLVVETVRFELGGGVLSVCLGSACTYSVACLV